LPSNTTNRGLTWCSSDDTIASVDENGIITAHSPGVAEVTVTTKNGITATSKITVNPGITSVIGVRINITEMTLIVGATGTLIATVLPLHATNRNTTWNSSDGTVASVDESGIVTAHSPGVTEIIVTTEDGKRTATSKVTVNAPVISVIGVELNKSSLTLYVGSIETLIATVLPENAANRNVTWHSNNRAVATVDDNGKVTAIAPGRATISVITTDGAISASCAVMVQLPLVIEDGVMIDGIRWATRNVDAPGTFAQNSANAGMFFQWNSRIGWSSIGAVINSDGGTTWSSSSPTGTSWTSENDPCPPGWRVPTQAELTSLQNTNSVWTNSWNGTGVGRIFDTAPNQVFLPAAGWRDSDNGMLNSVNVVGRYWSSTPDGSAARFLSVSGGMSIPGDSRALGLSVRCVAK
jgi:uncharacterized protein YjdB